MFLWAYELSIIRFTTPSIASPPHAWGETRRTHSRMEGRCQSEGYRSNSCYCQVQSRAFIFRICGYPTARRIRYIQYHTCRCARSNRAKVFWILHGHRSRIPQQKEASCGISCARRLWHVHSPWFCCSAHGGSVCSLFSRISSMSCSLSQTIMSMVIRLHKEFRVSHHDLTEGNIVVDETNQLRIIDFGRAEIEHDCPVKPNNQTPDPTKFRPLTRVNNPAWIPCDELRILEANLEIYKHRKRSALRWGCISDRKRTFLAFVRINGVVRLAKEARKELNGLPKLRTKPFTGKVPMKELGNPPHRKTSKMEEPWDFTVPSIDFAVLICIGHW